MEYTVGGRPKTHVFFSTANSLTSGSTHSTTAVSVPEGPVTSPALRVDTSVRGPAAGRLLYRAEAFSDQGILHPDAFNKLSDFVEDGRPLPFPELYAWWTAEVKLATELRASAGLAPFAGAELTAIRDRTKRYRRHGSDSAQKTEGAKWSKSKKRARGPVEATGPDGPNPNPGPAEGGDITRGPKGGKGVRQGFRPRRESSATVSRHAEGPDLSGPHLVVGVDYVGKASCGPEVVKGTRGGLRREAKKTYGPGGAGMGGPSNLSNIPCSSQPVRSIDSGPEGPQKVPPHLGDEAEAVENGPPRRLSYMESFDIMVGGDHVPDTGEALRFFRLVGKILGSIADDALNVRAGLAKYVERIVREE